MLSLVVPVYNEQDSLAKLHAEIAAVGQTRGYDWELILIDDGSTDGSWQVIESLAAQDARVTGIRFRRNFGKAAALSAGFQQVRGDITITLDADLQDDPQEIPRFLAQLESGLDVVSGWKQVRHDPWHKVGPSRVFNWLVSRLTGVKLHDHNCGMKAYRSEVFREVQLYGEMHRFIPVLAAARGFRVGEIAIAHRARSFGQSKYGLTRFVKGFLDLLTVKFLTGFGKRPQHLLGTIGLGFFALGGFTLLYLAAYWVYFTLQGIDPLLRNRPVLLYAVAALLVGAQMLSLGLIAELLTSYQHRSEQTYSIRQRTPAR